MKKTSILIAILVCVIAVTGCTSFISKTEDSSETKDSSVTRESSVTKDSSVTKESSVTEECTKTRAYQDMLCSKPVIYLYPKEERKVSVKLDYNGELTCTYPEYQDGWNVIAKPDGTLTNIKDNREYSYLYWEGVADVNWDMSKGFVVAGSDTARFLQEKLEYMGLTPREYNEFIVYWLPILQKNKYNLITFAGKDYEELAKLTINPEPDSILRIMMLYKPLEESVVVKEQKLEPFTRTGFTVVEWGGIEVKQGK